MNNPDSNPPPRAASSAWLFRAACLSGAAAVLLGAFGAHALKAKLEAAGLRDTWETAVFYHFVHTLALLFLSGRSAPAPKAATACLWAGVGLFSGSLYLMGLTEIRKLGAITPIGGVCWIAAWVMLAARGLPANPGGAPPPVKD